MSKAVDIARVRPEELRAVGQLALLIERAEARDVLPLAAAIRRAADRGEIDDLVEVIPAANTVLVSMATSFGLRKLANVLPELAIERRRRSRAKKVSVEVVYDGEDLERVAELTGLGVDGVIAAHTQQTWTAAFTGFAPGFAYLVPERAGAAGAPDESSAQSAQSEPPRSPLFVPRLETPRTNVSAGSVALAGEYSAVYPGASPGGWQLIGNTDANLFDPAAKSPAVITPGTRVVFTRVDRLRGLRRDGPEKPSAGRSSKEAAARDTTSALLIDRPGVYTTVQDDGRPGHHAIGITDSGALDRGAAQTANRIAGNIGFEAVLEILGGNFAATARGDLLVAVTGAPAAITIEGPDDADPMSRAPGATFVIPAGSRLVIGPVTSGLRVYLAVVGGVDVETVLGSRSRDTLAGLGPEPLRDGDILPVGPRSHLHVVGPAVPIDVLIPGEIELEVVAGPRDDRIVGGIGALVEVEWIVSDEADRVGLRLAGEPLRVDDRSELPSEGTVAGAVQVPPSGKPVVFLADHPVTGGYPVVGVVTARTLDFAAQAAPGTTVRFRAIDGPLG